MIYRGSQNLLNVILCNDFEIFKYLPWCKSVGKKRLPRFDGGINYSYLYKLGVIVHVMCVGVTISQYHAGLNIILKTL